jgi:membrane-associated phospholipid phosphatase
MKIRLPATLFLGVLCVSSVCAAQEATNTPLPGAESAGPVAKPTEATPSLIRPLVGDFKRFFQKDTAQTVALFGLGALAVSTVDQNMVRMVDANGAHAALTPGRIGGMFYLHAGAGVSTYFLGRAVGSNTVAKVGAEVFRAQLLSQSVVQVGKHLTQRSRPDGSNRQSLPSGHTASGFATAGVLQRNFGWKVGVPAYAFAAYIGASRIDSSKHHISDVVLGAGIGWLSARAVSLPIAGQKFNVSVTPMKGGGAITFNAIH